MMSVFYNIGFSRGVCGNKASETLNRLYYSIESARKQGFAGGRGKRDGADADPGRPGEERRICVRAENDRGGERKVSRGEGEKIFIFAKGKIFRKGIDNGEKVC